MPGGIIVILAIEGVKQLHRKSQEVFLCVISLQQLKEWRLPCLDVTMPNNEFVIISFDKLMESSATDMKISNPMLLYRLPAGVDTDEYPVLIISRDHYLSEYCENLLLTHGFINRIVESKDKISSNSTKLMTLRSFKEILSQLNEIYIERALWPKLSSDLVQYLKSLTEKYYYLGYLPVAERRRFRESSVADAGFAWDFYIRFFIEEWIEEQGEVSIPRLDKVYEQQDWSGDFFSRQNPLLRRYTSRGGKFNFNETDRDLIYKTWKEWLLRA